MMTGILLPILFVLEVAGLESEPRAPRLLQAPPNQVHFSNSTGGEIRCTADGSPTPVVTWLHADGRPVTEIPALRHVRPNGILLFSPFPANGYRQEVHSTAYHCRASNRAGTIRSRDVHVRAVLLQEEHRTQKTQEPVLPDNTAVLQCPIPDDVREHVTVTSWQRNDGFVITPRTVGGKYVMLSTGDLYIRNLTTRDSAYTFRCNTANFLEGTKLSSTNSSQSHTTEPPVTQLTRITRRSDRTLVTAGHQTTLLCELRGDSPPTYHRFRPRRNSHVAMDTGSRLASQGDGGVHWVQRSEASTDSRRYVCMVSNPSGDDQGLFLEEPLQVSVSSRKPQSEGRKLSMFMCTVNGRPPDTAGWRKDSKLSLGPTTRIRLLSPTTLQLRQLKKQEAGTYQCSIESDTQSEQPASHLSIGDQPPDFKVTFPEQTVHPGTSVSLKCVARGTPPPQITWSLDDIWTLSSRPGLTISSSVSPSRDVTSYLTIGSSDVSAGGEYTCKATNPAGTATHSRRLNVVGPLFVRPLTSLSALEGDDFAVHCPFGGYPYHAITWKKDGRPLTQRQRSFPNGTMAITAVQKSQDEGQYTCEVSNLQGQSAHGSFRLIVRARPQVAPFTFSDDLREGMRTAVTCIVVAGDGPLITKWLKDGKPVSEKGADISIVYAAGGFVSTLTINSLANRHTGNYTCVATNDAATDSYSALLTVKVLPRWVIEPKDTSAVAGKAAIIDCQAEGVPEPHVRWKVSTGPPPAQFRTVISSSQLHTLANGSLTFRRVEVADEGVYLCEASNGIGPGLSTAMRLSVHSPPHFQTRLTTRTMQKSQRAQIECSARGDRPIVFFWRKNGILLDPVSEPRYSIAMENAPNGAMSRLTIAAVDRKDSSLFTCVARNDYGEDAMDVQLTVQDIPDVPQGIETHDVTSRSVRLTWTKPFSGNSVITQFIVHWKETSGQSSGNQMTVPGTQNSATIRSLLPGTSYSFRVQGENALGKGEISPYVIVITADEPPRNPPRVMKVVASSAQSVNISWEMPPDDRGSRNVDGYYVGYKVRGSSDPYTYKTVAPIEGSRQECYLAGLNRSTEYSITIQAFNSRGAGPATDGLLVQTLEFDRPSIPTMKTFFTTSTTIKLSWEISVTPVSPVSGFLLYHRREGGTWLETHLAGDRVSYTLHDLDCGTPYRFYLVAFNSAGRGEPSEEVSARTDGGAPVAPDKKAVLSVNSTFVFIHLTTWGSGGCPISFFVIQYRPRGQQEWTLVSNNIVPEQVDVTLVDLSPGTWYSLLMTAQNGAGSTDAEYVFATLTLAGEQPPRPEEVTDDSGALYRHLTVTVPVASSAVVLSIVLLSVCFITWRRAPAPEGTTTSEQGKTENMPLSVTSDSSQEPTYFPPLYATSHVPVYPREHGPPSAVDGTQNLEQFGGPRSGSAYGIPFPPPRTEKVYRSYGSPRVLYCPPYQNGLRESREDEVRYQVPDRHGVFQTQNVRGWREAGDGNSSSDSDNEEPMYSMHPVGGAAVRDEALEYSEAECDRLWKNLQDNYHEAAKRWVSKDSALL